MRLFTIVAVAVLLCGIAGPSLHADALKLNNGDVLHGKIVKQTDQAITFSDPQLSDKPLVIARDDVASITIESPPTKVVPAESPATAPAKAPAASQPKAGGASGGLAAIAKPPVLIVPQHDSFFDNWKSSLALGFAGASGNTENKSFNGEFKATKETKTDRWLFDLTYFYGASDHETTQNNFTGKVTKDWLNPGKDWFTFARGEYDYDEFQPWESRVSGFGGVGYTFVSNPKFEWLGRIGVGLTKEFGGERRLYPEGMLSSAVTRWHITEAQDLTAEATLYPAFDHLGEYRLETKVEWSVKLDHAHGLRLKLGIQDKYQSRVEDGAKRNDLKYYGALVVDF